MKRLRERFGRPLRLALIGGGPASWIGRMHQTAAELDGYWRVVAGVFSSDPARSREAGTELGFDPARSYGEVRELLDKYEFPGKTIPIIDVTGPEPVEHRGYVPPRSVVVPGTRPKEFPAGTYNLACALIIGRRKESTDLRTSLNDALREFGISTG